jgi:hypothetical protein
MGCNLVSGEIDDTVIRICKSEPAMAMSPELQARLTLTAGTERDCISPSIIW